MRRIPAAAALALIFTVSACGNAADVTEYLDIPFTCRAQVRIASSEYTLAIEKGGADLVRVTVIYPEALEGLTVSSEGEGEVAFRASSVTQGSPYSVAELIFDAFSASRRRGATTDGETSVVGFASDHGEGLLRVDAFSAVPISLEADGVYMEFTDFKR